MAKRYTQKELLAAVDSVESSCSDSEFFSDIDDRRDSTDTGRKRTVTDAQAEMMTMMIQHHF